MFRKTFLAVMLIGFGAAAVSCGGGHGDGGPAALSTVFQGTFALVNVSATDNGITATITYVRV